MPVKLNPTSQIKLHLGIDPNGRIQKFATNTCAKHMDKYVPMDRGNLRNITTITANSITYEMPYARYQYYRVRDDGSHKVLNYTTPGTVPYWDKRMLSTELDDIIQEIQEAVDGT